MSWFNKNEYKTYFKQKLKAEKKQFKIALGIEKYRIKKSNCLKYILNQIDLKIDRYIKKLLKDLLKNILIKNFAIQLNIKTHIFDLSTYKK